MASEGNVDVRTTPKKNLATATATANTESLQNGGSPSNRDKRENYLIWDDYFMGIALLSAKRSKDPKTQVGACIVDGDNRIVSIGYNGFPRGCHDDEFPWDKEKHFYVVHAEANAILNKNTADVKGMKIYTTLFPCNECAKLIIQSGIKEIYYLSDKYGLRNDFLASRKMLEATKVKCEMYKPTQKQIVIDFEHDI